MDSVFAEASFLTAAATAAAERSYACTKQLRLQPQLLFACTWQVCKRRADMLLCPSPACAAGLRKQLLRRLRSELHCRLQCNRGSCFVLTVLMHPCKDRTQPAAWFTMFVCYACCCGWRVCFSLCCRAEKAAAKEAGK